MKSNDEVKVLFNILDRTKVEINKARGLMELRVNAAKERCDTFGVELPQKTQRSKNLAYANIR